MTDHTKKPYTKPAIIDLSIEGITGIGAGTCNNGPGIATGTCTTHGKGATSDCILMGNGLTTACITGGFPFESGTICSSHGLSASACYTNGSATNQGMSRCITSGLSAVHSTPACCFFNGASDSNLCFSGTSYIPTPPHS